MKLRLGRNTQPPPFTMKGLMEMEYNALWEQANQCVDKLSALQGEVARLLPKAKEQQPGSVYSIQLHSLYKLGNHLWEEVESQCQTLAKASEHYDKEDAETALKETLDFIESLPLEGLLADKESGIWRLKEACEKMPGGSDWQVFGSWRFSDIMGTLRSTGKLLQACAEAPVPDAPNLGLLLDDDTLMRIY